MTIATCFWPQVNVSSWVLGWQFSAGESILLQRDVFGDPGAGAHGEGAGRACKAHSRHRGHRTRPGWRQAKQGLVQR
jgi:hypothetical protein